MPRAPKLPKHLRDGQTRPGAVIKEALRQEGIDPGTNGLGGFKGGIPTKTEVLEVFGAIMYGDFSRWKLEGLTAAVKLDAILKAAVHLGKHHGIFQKPSQNDADRQVKIDQFVGAMFSFREVLEGEGKPADSDAVWDELVKAALRADKPTQGHKYEQELHSLRRDIMDTYSAIAERREERQGSQFIQ